MTMSMSKDKINALKANHRIEDIMREAGEAFEIDANNPDLWHGTITKGLTVNIRRQTYELNRPGLEVESGDLIAWLKHRNAWTFGMVIRFLQNYKPDPNKQGRQPTSTQPAARAKAGKLKQYAHYFEREEPITEANEAGLYDHGVGYRDGKTYHYYKLKPCDHLQESALEFVGEEMREFFTWPADILKLEMDDQPTRFVPVQDMTIVYCDECGEPIDWFWKQKPYFDYQQAFIPGSGGYAKRGVRIYPEPEIYAFEYELWGDTYCICRECKNKKIDFRRALELLYESAYQREAPERERQAQIKRELDELEERRRKKEEERKERELEAQEF